MMILAYSIIVTGIAAVGYWVWGWIREDKR